MKTSKTTTTIEGKMISHRNVAFRFPTTDFIDSDDNDQRSLKLQSIINDDIEQDRLANSFHESDRTDSGFGGDSALNWRVTPSQPTFNGEFKPRATTEMTSQPSKETLKSIRLEKAGWLHVKHWLTVQQPGKLELASKRQWKHFWIHLKGTTLQLFNDYSDDHAKSTIETMDCLCYPLPEHPHRQFVFNLTTATGDTYSIQSADHGDLDQWIRAIHYQCLLKRKEDSVRSEIEQLKEKIQRENQIVKLAQLQLKVIGNEKTRSLIVKQIELWENHLESFHVDIFRLQCYLAALSNHHCLPNPQDLLSSITTRTKSSLFKLMAFTPCGFYSWIIARHRCDGQQVVTKNLIGDDLISFSVTGDSTVSMKSLVSIRRTATVTDLLRQVTEQFKLAFDDYLLYWISNDNQRVLPKENDQLETLTFSSIFIGRKVRYQITFDCLSHLAEIDLGYDQSSRLFVSHVREGSESQRLGIRKGDEILLINNTMIADLDLHTFNDYFNKTPLVLTLRSSRPSSTMKSSSDCQRLEKVREELIETERSYIEDLQCLLKQYIEPLCHNRTILSSDVIDALKRSVREIYQFHFLFLQRLEVCRTLDSIGETFLQHADQFKVYSNFCAVHLRLNRLIEHQQNNVELKEFLLSCNPTEQHSSSFQSFLIKPVQRIVKYPLFLQQLFSHAKTNKTIKRAMKMTLKISQYVNSMQQLYEEFGQTFERILQQYQKENQIKLQLNLPDLYAYGEIDWINMDLFFSEKMRRRSCKTFCFVFANGFLLLTRESTKKNPIDRFIRFIPLQELNVDLLDMCEEQIQHWHLIQIDRKTRQKTYFQFANKNAHIYVKTIKNCISLISKDDRPSLRTCELSFSIDRSTQRCLSSHSDKTIATYPRQSPSPVWKRRTTHLQKRNHSTIDSKRFV